MEQPLCHRANLVEELRSAWAAPEPLWREPTQATVAADCCGRGCCVLTPISDAEDRRCRRSLKTVSDDRRCILPPTLTLNADPCNSAGPDL